MNMLERAARALHERRRAYDDMHLMEPWESLDDVRRRRCSADARAVLAAIREPDDATASRAIDIAYEAENAMSGERCPVMRNHIRSYVDAILEGERK